MSRKRIVQIVIETPDGVLSPRGKSGNKKPITFSTCELESQEEIIMLATRELYIMLVDKVTRKTVCRLVSYTSTVYDYPFIKVCGVISTKTIKEKEIIFWDLSNLESYFPQIDKYDIMIIPIYNNRNDILWVTNWNDDTLGYYDPDSGFVKIP